MTSQVTSANGLRLARVVENVVNIGVVSHGAARLHLSPLEPGAKCEIVSAGGLRLILQPGGPNAG
jgi:hypothetical protein